MRGLILFVVIVALLLFGADRVAVSLAQDAIGKRVASEYDLAHRPTVRIRGFPFLTQAAQGRYHDIDVAVGDWTAQDVTVHDVTVALSDVAAPIADVIRDNTSSFVADSAQAVALVPYDAVRRYAPDGVSAVSYNPDGLQLTGRISVAGIHVPGSVVVTATTTADGLELIPVRVTGPAGPSISVRLLKNYLGFHVPLHNLPFGAHLTNVTATPDGLEVTAKATDVKLNGH
jgi:hypothetical protein